LTMVIWRILRPWPHSEGKRSVIRSDFSQRYEKKTQNLSHIFRPDL
jgi:hypothetical protein